MQGGRLQWGLNKKRARGHSSQASYKCCTASSEKKSCSSPDPKIIRGAIARPVTPERSHHLRWFRPRLLGWCWSFQHSSSNHSYKECTSRHPRASHCEFMRAGGLVLYLGKMNSVLHILRPNPNFFSVALISSDILKPRQHTVLQDLLRAAHPAKATCHLINFKYVSHCWFHGCWLPFWLVFPWWAPVLVLMIHFLLDAKSHWFFLVWFFTMVEAWMNTKWKSAGLGDTSLAASMVRHSIPQADLRCSVSVTSTNQFLFRHLQNDEHITSLALSLLLMPYSLGF